MPPLELACLDDAQRFACYRDVRNLVKEQRALVRTRSARHDRFGIGERSATDMAGQLADALGDAAKLTITIGRDARLDIAWSARATTLPVPFSPRHLHGANARDHLDTDFLHRG